MAKSVCLWLRRPPNSSPPRHSDNAVQKISELGAMQMHGGISQNGLSHYDLIACHDDEARRPKASHNICGRYFPGGVQAMA
jgi:hypothetical protein